MPTAGMATARKPGGDAAKEYEGKDEERPCSSDLADGLIRSEPPRTGPARPPLDLLAHSGGGDRGWSMGIGADGTGWPVVMWRCGQRMEP